MPRALTSLAKGLVTLAIVAGAAGAVYYSYVYKPPEKPQAGGQNRRPGVDFPVPVVVGIAKRADVPITFDGVGTARALNTVTIKPQVDGKILSLNFKEGQDVKKGQLLAKIDPTTYQAQVDQAMARKALSEVQLANAKRDMARYAKISSDFVAQKTVDTQKAAVDQLEAQIKSDAAAIANLKAFVDWTNVVAPIDGRTGIRLVDEGNLVRASDAGIVTISQLKPIAVTFTLPQQQLAQVNRSMALGALQVETIDSDGKTVLDRGTVQVVDNLVDQATGTVRLKAELPNAEMQLWPGQFVNIRLLVDTLKQVVVIPTPAVQRGPTGPFVYVAGSDNKVVVRPITVGLQAEVQTVVTKGVEPDERVVTTGFGRLKDGSTVHQALPGETPAMTPPTAGAGKGEGRGRGEGKRRREGGDGGEAKPTPSAGAPSAGGDGKAPAAAGGGGDVRTACRADVETHCASVMTDRDARRACMETNKDKLSDGCKAALRAAFGGGATSSAPPASGPSSSAKP